MPKPMVANPGETVYIGGLPFTIYTSGRGIVRYRSTETRWEKVFKVQKDESVAALEARIAADLADLGIVVGTPRGSAAECATQAETSASSRPARQSGDKAKRSPEVIRAHGRRAGRETAPGWDDAAASPAPFTRAV